MGNLDFKTRKHNKTRKIFFSFKQMAQTFLISLQIINNDCFARHITFGKDLCEKKVHKFHSKAYTTVFLKNS